MNRKQFLNYILRNEVTDTWLRENEKDLKKVVGYIWNAFIYTPQALVYLNKHLNTYDYNSFSLKDKVLFIQFVIRENGLVISWLNTEFQPRVDREKDFELDKELTSADKRALWHLANDFKLFETNKTSNQFTKPKKLTEIEKKKINEAIEKAEKQVSSTQVLETLTQEIIDEMELTLFDISVLESRNRIQYTFLDKRNLKVVYREPYKMNVKFHPSGNIFDKDYFENNENLYEYVFTSTWDYMKFRKALNESFLNSLMV